MNGFDGQVFQQIVESSTDLIVIIDQERRFQFVNHVVEGLTIEQVLGSRIEDFTPQEYQHIAVTAVQEAFDSGTQVTYEIAALGDKGNLAYYLCRVIPLGDDGSGSQACIISTDITQKRRAEEQLEQWNAELEARVDEQTAVLRSTLEHQHELTRLLQATQERERAHLARELHDEAGGLIATLGLQLTSVFPEGLPASMDRTLTRLHDSIRQISGNLRSSTLDDFGIVAAIEEWLESMSDQPAPAIRFEHTLEAKARFDDSIETVVFRLFQEALTNAIKHAEASVIRISLESETDRLHFRFRDDGIGMPVDTYSKPGHFGIQGMHERVELINGTMEIRSTPGSGTEILVSLPLGPSG